MEIEMITWAWNNACFHYTTSKATTFLVQKEEDQWKLHVLGWGVKHHSSHLTKDAAKKHVQKVMDEMIASGANI